MNYFNEHIVPSVSSVKLKIHRLLQQRIVSNYRENKYNSEELDPPLC